MSALRERARRRVLRSAPGLAALRWMVAERVRGPNWLDSAVGDDPTTVTLAARLGDEVQAGPFAGMALPVDAVCSERWPKLVGSYEEELGPVVARCVAHRYPVVVNVGAAEGYYSVGFARSGAGRVIAVDPLARARARLRTVAEANGVLDRIELRAVATRRRIDRWLAGGGLVVMDCEGAEYGLLDPERSPHLARADVLVEVHEFAVEGLAAELEARFAPTHDAEWIDQTVRRPEAMTALAGLDTDTQRTAVAELRPRRLRWAFFAARDAAA